MTFRWCMCGHPLEAHGQESDFPTSSMCFFNPNHSNYDIDHNGDDCECVAYETGESP